MNTYSKLKIIPTLIRFLTITTIFGLLSCTSKPSHSGGSSDMTKEYEKISTTLSYRSLATLDLDQVNDLLQVKLNSYFKDNSNVQSLKEAALIVFSRPDDDGVVEKVLSTVRNPLEEENEWNNTIVSLVRQSVETMTKSDASASDQVTSGVVLENIISEFKPVYIKQYKTGGFETEIINYIAESEATYSKAASKERGLYLMRNNLAPQQIAAKLVANKEAYLEQDSKKQK